MKAEHINPFINATRRVLNTMAFMDSKPGKPALKQDSKAQGEVSALIKLEGGTTGSIGISFSKDCILSIAANMLGQIFEKLDDEILDLVGELVNMISGEARRELAELGFQFTAGIPSTYMGVNHELKHEVSGPILAIPFETDGGSFVIEASFLSETFFEESEDSQRMDACEDLSNTVQEIQLQSLVGNTKFPAYVLIQKSQETKTNIFLFKEFVGAKDGYSFCNYLLLNMYVCPDTYFSSNQISYFQGEGVNTQGDLFTESGFKEKLVGSLEKLSMLSQFPDSFFTSQRTVEQAIVAYEMAMFTSKTLFNLNKKSFVKELSKMVEYALKAALLSKYQLNIQREMNYMNTAQKILQKLLIVSPVKDRFRLLYLLTAISTYIGDTATAKQYFDQFFELHQKHFDSLENEQTKKLLKGYMELLKQVWGMQDQLNIKKNRKIKNYLFVDADLYLP